jgi:hypothetical protein
MPATVTDRRYNKSIYEMAWLLEVLNHRLKRAWLFAAHAFVCFFGPLLVQ